MLAWRPRFWLRTLLIATAICGLLLAPVAVEVSRWRHDMGVIGQLVGRKVPATSLPRIATYQFKYGPFAALLPDSIRFGSVQRLWIYQMELDQHDLDVLTGLSGVEELDLSSCSLKNADLKCLARLPELRLLQLQDTGLTDSEIFALQEAKPGLEVLDD